MGEGAPISNPICSICFEDLRAVAEDLQTISACGHVFHELCLQQWFEYCSNGKKKNCPVCKQSCSNSNVIRLYFQFIGDIDCTNPSQKKVNPEEYPEELARENKRLEAKLSGVTSASERYQKELKELHQQLSQSMEEAKMEAQLKNDAMKEKELLQLMLCSKSEELQKSILECLRLQERNVSLAKELAALKLVSDVNLDEDDILKLASFGNEGSSKDAIDVLRKSLVIRNKNYKELMAKCNFLGRGEARSLIKLEKAKDKITKLKERVQELETAVEIKDNDALRALKNSHKDTLSGRKKENIIPSSLFGSRIDVGKHGAMNDVGTRRIGCIEAETCEHMSNEDVNKPKNKTSTDAHYKEKDNFVVIDDDENSTGIPEDERSQQSLEDLVQENNPVVFSAVHKISHAQEASELMNSPRSWTNHELKNGCVIDLDRDDVINLDNGRQHNPLLHIRRQPPMSSIPNTENCFKGGLIGPDGTARYLGKWCKRNKSDGSMPMPSSDANSHDLIAVGADGRGGTIKALRSLSHSIEEVEQICVRAKKCKLGPKSNTFHSKGCMQIENFFGKVG